MRQVPQTVISAKFFLGFRIEEALRKGGIYAEGVN